MRRWQRKADLRAQIAELSSMLDSLEKQNGLEAEKVRTLLDRNRDAHAIAEMAKRSIDPLTMTHQYLSNITLILQGKDPLP